MTKNSFIAYNDRIDYMDDMPMEQRGILFTAILNYQNWLEVWDLWEVKYIWNKIRKEIDANTEKYEEVCNKRSVAWKKHKWNQYTKWDDERNSSQKAQKNTVEQMEQNGTNGTDSDSDSEYDNINKNNNNKLSPIGDNSEAETYWNQEINNLISELKEECNRLGVAYEKTREREFWKHILTAKDYWEFAEKIWQSRVQFAKNILIASCHLKYKWICAWPKAIYQHYAEIYNEFVKNKPKPKAVVLDDL